MADVNARTYDEQLDRRPYGLQLLEASKLRGTNLKLAPTRVTLHHCVERMGRDTLKSIGGEGAMKAAAVSIAVDGLDSRPTWAPNL